jgi:hypothetical protein
MRKKQPKSQIKNKGTYALKYFWGSRRNGKVKTYKHSRKHRVEETKQKHGRMKTVEARGYIPFVGLELASNNYRTR